jgi:hypothetical protein
VLQQVILMILMIRLLSAVLALALCFPAAARARQDAISIDGNVALSSLMALADNHVMTMADTLETLAATGSGRSGDWDRISGGLRKAAAVNVPAVMWYARTDGTYFTTEKGLQSAKVSDRPYFARVLAGQTVIGDLVVSKSTGKPVAVVVVPIKDKSGTVTGILGGSIYLDKLSALLSREMAITPGMVFWAMDATGTVALHSASADIIMSQPATLSAELKRVTDEMLAQPQGVETYTYRGVKRTMLFRKSTVTGWIYGFGIVR